MASDLGLYCLLRSVSPNSLGKCRNCVNLRTKTIHICICFKYPSDKLFPKGIVTFCHSDSFGSYREQSSDCDLDPVMSLDLDSLMMVLDENRNCHSITKTRLYNFDPLKPHVYIVKLGFTGIHIIFIIFAKKHRLCVLVGTTSSRRF